MIFHSCRHFKDPLKIWFEFLPQLLFIGCIFGYLVIIIVYKWLAFDVYSEHVSWSRLSFWFIYFIVFIIEICLEKQQNCIDILICILFLIEISSALKKELSFLYLFVRLHDNQFWTNQSQMRNQTWVQHQNQHSLIFLAQNLVYWRKRAEWSFLLFILYNIQESE